MTTTPTQQLPDPIADDSDDVSFAKYLDILRANIRIIIVVSVIAVILGAIYAFCGTPIYEADMLVQVEDSSGPASTAVAELSSVFDVKTQATTEIQIIRSRLVVSQAVSELKLDVLATPNRFPIVGKWLAAKGWGSENPGIFGLGGYAWSNESLNVGHFDVPGKLLGTEFTVQLLPDAKYRLLNSELETTYEGRIGQEENFSTPLGVVRLLLAGATGKPGVRFTLIRKSTLATINDLQQALTILEAAKDSDVIEVTLDGDDPVQVTQTLQAIGAEYVRQNAARKAEEATKQLEFLGTLLPSLKQQLLQAEIKYNQFRNQRGTIDLTTEGSLMLQQSVDIQTKLQEAQVQRQQLLTRFAAGHPSVIGVDRQIEQLQSNLDQLSSKIRRLPNEEQEAVGLMRDVQVNTQIYTTLLVNSEQLRVTQAGKVANVRIVDNPVVPEKPIKPRKGLSLVLALLGGVLLGSGLAFARNALFGGIADPHDIEQKTGLNVYAVIPYSEEQATLFKHLGAGPSGAGLLVRTNPTNPVAESLRSFRTALQFSLQEAQNNVVMLTGPTAGVGKSFISVNLAELLGASGKRVLLLDADLRKGYLNRYFGIPRGKGLSEWIAGTATMEEVIQSSEAMSFDLIPTGSLPAHPYEMLSSGAFKECVAALQRRYELVLIDAPPTLPVADSHAISMVAGSTFLIARFETTSLGEIQESVRRLARVGSTVKGVIFNGVKLRSSGIRYGGRYSRYRYDNYSYYTYENDRDS